MPSSRRDFLLDVSRLAALCAVVPNDWRVRLRPRFEDDPFALGAASGDPTPTGAVIWTRLAPRPLEPEGGMPGNRVAVRWEVAEDEAFAHVVRKGTATAAPELSYSVHVDVDGLAPDRWYFYRFQSGDAVTQTARLRTAPAAGAVTPLRLGAVSCQNWEAGYFTAYQHLATEELDLVAHLGDYIYEYVAGSERAVRRHTGLECRTLDDYRRRYAQYKTDPHLQAAHLRCPWVVTWDDHEVDNNYADLFGENEMESAEQMRARRAAAYQAYWEHQAVRVPRARDWADLTIRRGIDWGALARLWMLDTRQYRSDQACGDGIRTVPCAEWGDPSRTLLGAAQERWLFDGLRESRAAWQMLGNNVMLAPFDHKAGPETQYFMDPWTGYPAARERLMRAVADHARHRTVVLTGDVHSSWTCDLRAGNTVRQDGPVVATEFIGTSLTSGGDGGDRANYVSEAALAESTHVKWHDNRRGYMRCTVTPTEWRTDYRTMPFVSKPDAPVKTATSWVVERGRAGVQRV